MHFVCHRLTSRMSPTHTHTYYKFLMGVIVFIKKKTFCYGSHSKSSCEVVCDTYARFFKGSFFMGNLHMKCHLGISGLIWLWFIVQQMCLEWVLWLRRYDAYKMHFFLRRASLVCSFSRYRILKNGNNRIDAITYKHFWAYYFDLVTLLFFWNNLKTFQITILNQDNNSLYILSFLFYS